jgi:hypothetical protein
MTVFSLLLVLAGIALIVGAKDFAGKVMKGLLVAVLALAMLPCLLDACCCHGIERGGRSPGGSTTGPWSVLILVVLAVAGLIAWRRRSDSARAREALARRHGSPRVRALPPPPPPQDQA